ncbi:MAG: hypothetical protein B6241_04120 [Spirochaetaceae bacterium 4572_59]|nr:MAG: hypothetical protein B6241_04120 [Spirochaetaceae bacterium 4572_59]
MEFKENRPIFIQIADNFCERILTGSLKNEERIPSVRETAAEFQVNPNTVVRTYNYLQETGIIRNQRGIGYFLTSDARNRTLSSRQNHFLNKELPQLFKTMSILKIDRDTLIAYYDDYINK